MGALVDTARGLYVERARSQSLARRRVALLAVAKVERQSMAPKLKAVSELEACRSMEMGGARGPSLAVKYQDLRTMGRLPEGRLRLTWLRLDALPRVTRCNNVFGI